MDLDLLLVQFDELLTKVEIRCIWTVVNRQTFVVDKFFLYHQRLMDTGIIIEENEWPIILSAQGFHPVEGICKKALKSFITLEALYFYEE